MTVRITSVVGKRVASIDTNRLDDRVARAGGARQRGAGPPVARESGVSAGAVAADVSRGERLLRVHRRPDDRGSRARGVARPRAIEGGEDRGCRLHRRLRRLAGRRELDTGSSPITPRRASRRRSRSARPTARRRDGRATKAPTGRRSNRSGSPTRRACEMPGLARQDRARSGHLRGGARTDRRRHADARA